MNPLLSAALFPTIGFTSLKIAAYFGHKNGSASSAENQKPANENQAPSNSRDTAMKLCAA
jgi:hypothetical protein